MNNTNHNRDFTLLIGGALLGNFASAAVIFFYFAYIDLETFRVNRAFWRGTQIDWTTFVVVMLLLGGLAWLSDALYARPLREWDRRLADGESAANVPDAVRRRAANLPLFMALVSLGMWAAAGLFFGGGGLKFGSTTVPIFWRTFLGAAVVGGLTDLLLVFLFVESLWRRHLPRFFPAGHLSQAQAPRISVGLRLAAGLLLTGVMPLIVLGAAARNSALDIMQGGIDPYEILRRLETTVLFIVGVALVSNLALSLLTARSLLQPLGALTRAMRRVAGGDLSMRVPVDSSDEIGGLADRFNDMLADLQQAQRMRDLFGKYVSREVAAQVLKDGAMLGGISVQATALFADIRDFTGLAERLPPQEVVGLLNRYYTRMVDVIVAEGGIVNKFGGDSLLAIFGAPIRQPDHALRAVRAAWQMTRALAEVNAEQMSLSMPTLTIGVGISSGEVVAGNVGGEARLEYTVI
ncbi:MAG: adenylate/guanylate cyclase domain-containing protein, partial [Chloroflexi bacterium]|nr:adenylate/guanylate cyclase domain-containing protein [Chloroflexota bacterium]